PWERLASGAFRFGQERTDEARRELSSGPNSVTLGSRLRPRLQSGRTGCMEAIDHASRSWTVATDRCITCGDNSIQVWASTGCGKAKYGLPFSVGFLSRRK